MEIDRHNVDISEKDIDYGKQILKMYVKKNGIKLDNEKEIHFIVAAICRDRLISEPKEKVIEKYTTKWLEYDPAMITYMFDSTTCAYTYADHPELLADSDTESDTTEDLTDSASDEEMIDDEADILALKKYTNMMKLNVKLPVYQWRKNQLEAINNTHKQNFMSGLHNQIMGAGKTNIILKLISDHYAKYQENKTYLLICDRKEILREIFFTNGEIDLDKVAAWKTCGMCDLTMFDIIDFVDDKSGNIIKTINKKNKDAPALIVVNAQYLRGKEYDEIKENAVVLTMIDECHAVSAAQIYNMLLDLKYRVGSSIIGFSATPLRPKAESKLCNIFTLSKKSDPKNNNLNIISNYGLFDAIHDDVILPPRYHYIEVEKVKYSKKMNKKNIQRMNNNYDIIERAIRNVCVADKLPYRKFICWCRTISQMRQFKSELQKRFPEFQVFSSCSADKDNAEELAFRDVDGYAMLLGVNRFREGSNFKNVDCAIYLDAVVNRSMLVSMQTSGRTLRKDEQRLKTHGTIIDIFLSDKKRKPIMMTVDKIMDYYTMVINLADNKDIRTDHNNQYDRYVKFRDLLNKTSFNTKEKKVKIDINNGKNITMTFDMIDTTNDMTGIKDLLDEEIRTREQFTKATQFRFNLRYLIETYGADEQNPIDWMEYYKNLCKEDRCLISYKKIYTEYAECWKNGNWFDVLKIRMKFYDIEDIPKIMKSNNIESEKDYMRAAKKDAKLPLDIFQSYHCLFNELLKLAKSKYKLRFAQME